MDPSLTLGKVSKSGEGEGDDADDLFETALKNREKKGSMKRMRKRIEKSTKGAKKSLKKKKKEVEKFLKYITTDRAAAEQAAAEKAAAEQAAAKKKAAEKFLKDMNDFTIGASVPLEGEDQTPVRSWVDRIRNADILIALAKAIGVAELYTLRAKQKYKEATKLAGQQEPDVDQVDAKLEKLEEDARQKLNEKKQDVTRIRKELKGLKRKRLWFAATEEEVQQKRGQLEKEIREVKEQKAVVDKGGEMEQASAIIIINGRPVKKKYSPQRQPRRAINKAFREAAKHLLDGFEIKNRMSRKGITKIVDRLRSPHIFTSEWEEFSKKVIEYFLDHQEEEAEGAAAAAAAMESELLREAYEMKEKTNLESNEAISENMKQFLNANPGGTIEEWAARSVWTRGTGGEMTETGAPERAMKGEWENLFEEAKKRDLIKNINRELKAQNNFQYERVARYLYNAANIMAKGMGIIEDIEWIEASMEVDDLLEAGGVDVEEEALLLVAQVVDILVKKADERINQADSETLKASYKVKEGVDELKDLMKKWWQKAGGAKSKEVLAAEKKVAEYEEWAAKNLVMDPPPPSHATSKVWRNSPV